MKPLILIMITLIFSKADFAHAFNVDICDFENKSQRIIENFQKTVSKNVWKGYNVSKIHFGLGESGKIILVNLKEDIVTKYDIQLTKCLNYSDVFVYEGKELPVRGENADEILQCSSGNHYRCDFAPELQRLYEEALITTYFYPNTPNAFRLASISRLERFIGKKSPVIYEDDVINTVIHEEFHAFQQDQTSYDSNRSKYLRSVGNVNENFNLWSSCLENSVWRSKLNSFNSRLLSMFQSQDYKSLKGMLSARRSELGLECITAYETLERFEGVAEYVSNSHLLLADILDKRRLIKRVDFFINGPVPYYSSGLILASYLKDNFGDSWQEKVSLGKSPADVILEK